MIRRHDGARALAIAATLGASVLAVGCARDDAAQAGGAETESAENGFATADELFEHLKTLPPEEARLAIYDLVITRTMTEKMFARFLRSIDRETLKYGRTINERFGQPDAPLLPVDLGMTEIQGQWRETDLEPWGQSRMKLEYVEGDGEPATLTFMRRRGGWRLHPNSLAFGRHAIDDVWFGSYQFTVMTQLKAYRDVNAGLAADAYASADEAGEALDAILTGPPPGPGSVTPD
jgi:hypothetical protein